MKGSLGDFRKNKKEKKQINIKNRNVAKKERSSAAVDEQFLSNLVQLGKIVLPSWRCKSVFLLSTQTVMLISRSYISLRIARKGGEGLQAVMEQKLEPLFIRVGGFLRVWNCCIRREFFVEILDEFHHGKLSP